MHSSIISTHAQHIQQATSVLDHTILWIEFHIVHYGNISHGRDRRSRTIYDLYTAWTAIYMIIARPLQRLAIRVCVLFFGSAPRHECVRVRRVRGGKNK